MVSELFETMPTVTLSGAPGAQNRQNIVLSGGVANANANGVWAATVLLSDGRTTEKVGVVTISVAPTPRCTDLCDRGLIGNSG